MQDVLIGTTRCTNSSYPSLDELAVFILHQLIENTFLGLQSALFSIGPIHTILLGGWGFFCTY